MTLTRATFLVPVLLILTGNVRAACSVPPSVSISGSLDNNGIVHGVVNYNFPDTENSGQRGLEVTVDTPDGSGVIAGFHPADASGSFEFTDVLSCRPSGSYDYKAKAITCGSLITNASNPISLVTTPTVNISYAGPDEFGHGSVTVDYNFPNTSSSSQRTLVHEVFDPNGSGLGPQLHPEQQQGTWVFSFPMTCRATGTYTHKITLQHCNGTVKTDTDDIEIQSDPTVTMSPSAPDDNGVIDLAVTFDFPNTDAVGQRRVDVLTQNAGGTGLISSFHPTEKTGTRHFPYNVACVPPQQLTFLGQVWSCGRGPVEDQAPVTISHAPTVSVSIAHNPLEAVVDYSFLGTGSSAQRTLRVEWVGGGLIGEIHPNTATGQARFPLSACGTLGTVRATAIACNNEQGVDEESVGAPKPPTATVTLRKGELDANGNRWIEGRLDYDMGDAEAGWMTRADLLPWTDANGQTQIGRNVLAPEAPTQRVGFRMFTILPDSGAQQVTVLGIAETCAGRGTDETSFPCGCEAATKDPVHFIDGNVRITDGDPLPRIAGHGLTRTYNSDEQVVALFGRGWTTLFERRLILNTDGSEQIVSVVTASNEVVTFRGTGGVYRQTWPTAQSAVGVLAYDAGSGTFSHRPAGSNEVSIFSAATGRVLALRDFQSGHEAQFAYDANGLPQSLTDSWSGVSWILTMEPGHRRVSSISVSGTPSLVWTYVYDGTGNLTTVTAPGSAPWRTYEYAADRMTASRDALGNLIESHTYDSDGYGISSTGPSDEIASIAYLPGATADERLTRITYQNNAIAEFTMRVVGGAWNLVRSDSGCASCGSGDATYARDDRGRVVREQGGDGYITATTYANDVVVSVQESLKPAGCDPQTDAQHCRLGPDALATTALESTSASVSVTYEHADPLWPDKVTAAVRPSVGVPGQLHREDYAFHPATGALVSAAVCGWAPGGSACSGRTTLTTFYEGSGAGLAPAFDPGGAFQSAWLTLPQPSLLPKSVDGSRTDVQDVSSLVYYPIDPTVPALLRGRLAAAKNAVGHITRYENYDVFGNTTRVVDPNGVAMEMTFDALGRTVTSTTKGVIGCNTADDPLCATDITTTRAYTSGAGPLRLDQRPGGGVTAYAYDARGRVQTVSRGPAENDLRERIETSYEPLTGKKALERTLAYEAGAWVEKRRQSFAYDSHARLQTVTHADGAAIHYMYDAEDRIATMRDENHAAPNTIYAYDPAGRLASVTQTLAGAPGGVITTGYAYDTDGNLTSVTDPNGNVTSYVYDDFGQLTSQESPVTGATTYAYDSVGNLTQMTDARGATTTRVYDALNRVTTATSTIPPKSEAISWSYDDPTAGRFAIGRLSSMTDPSGSTAYHYERRGLLRDETRTLTGAQYTYTTAFQYDADGNRAVVQYPSTLLTVQYGFDYAGRPTSASNLVTTASYLPFGPLKSLSFANGTTQTMSYDARYRVMSNSLTGQSTLGHYTYGYDAGGNITSILDATDSGYDRTFQYDDLNRLITANTGSALWRRGSYTWDAMGNMLSLKLGEIEKGPTDPLDAARHQRDRLRAEENVPLGRSSSFTYSETTPRLLEVITNDLSRPVGYDPVGNETSYVATRTYSLRNLLAEVTDPGEPGDPLQHKLTYTYDGRGIRVIRTESPANGPNTTARRFSIYTPELQLLAVTQDDASNIWAFSAADKNIHYEIVWFAGRPIAQVTPAGATLYTLTDHLGTPILQTDAAATVTWRAEYEPFGNVYEMRTGKRTDQPLRFPGQEVAMNWEGQEENYNIHRWYQSGWGRYTQSDPLGVLEHPALYSYSANSPVTNVDPLGLWSFTWAWGPGKPKSTLSLASTCLNNSSTDVACSNYKGLQFHCSCQCIGDSWAPKIVAFVNVEMYIYAGPITPGMAQDTSIVDFKTAQAHEVNQHLAPAAEALKKWLGSWVKDSSSAGECENTCQAVKNSKGAGIFGSALEKSKTNG